jgi:hypothetical protein
MQLSKVAVALFQVEFDLAGSLGRTAAGLGNLELEAVGPPTSSMP